MALDMATDELDSLRPLATSKEVFEASPADAQPQQDDLDEAAAEDDDTEGPNRVVPADGQAMKLYNECKIFGGKFRSLCSEIKTYAPYILAMKRFFGVKKGYAGRKVSFPEFPDGICWSEFCDEMFDLTPTRVNQLIDSVDEKPDNVRRSRPTEQHPAYIKGEANGYHKAIDEMIAKGVDVKASKTLQQIVADEPRNIKPKVDKIDPYSYWEALDDKSPNALAYEVLSMLDAVGLDSLDIKQVIAEMQKQHKPSTKPLNTRFTAAAA